jgi:hypothetical protein
MSGWGYMPENDSEPVVDELPPAPKPILETKLVDIAGESEAPKNYLNEGAEKPAFKAKQDSGEKFMNTPVDVYEPGFRSDVYEGLVEFFKKRRAEKDRLDRLREKMGLRR